VIDRVVVKIKMSEYRFVEESGLTKYFQSMSTARGHRALLLRARITLSSHAGAKKTRTPKHQEAEEHQQLTFLLARL
jgi:hypothetical protein